MAAAAFAEEGEAEAARQIIADGRKGKPAPLET